MKIVFSAVLVTILLFSFASCGLNNISTHPSLQVSTDASSSFQSSETKQPDEPVENILASFEGETKLEIAPIANYNMINGAFQNDDTIILIGQNKIPPYDSVPVWEDYPIEVYRYSLRSGEMDKIYEYTMDGISAYLYVEVLDNQDIVLKHFDGFTILSAENYQVKKEIKMDSTLNYINYNISPDGKKIAIVQKKQFTIIDSSTQEEIYTTEVLSAAYLQAPVWSKDSSKVFVHAPTIEFVDVVQVYDVKTNETITYDFSQRLITYDNQAFFVNNGEALVRFDNYVNENEKVVTKVEEFVLDSQTLSNWEFYSSMPIYCKSVSEKGYLIGYIYDEYFNLVFGNIQSQSILTTKTAQSGGGMVAPVWSRAQNKALALFTEVQEGDKINRWTAVVIDVEKMFLKLESEEQK